MCLSNLAQFRLCSSTTCTCCCASVRELPSCRGVTGVQGDKEREIGLSVSPLMDRQHIGSMFRSQVKLLKTHLHPQAYY